MKTFSKKILAAKIAFVMAVSTFHGVITPAYAGWPVFDGANLSQTIITAIQNVAIAAKQVQQYKTQLEQYESMLKNSTAPSQHIWDQATATMDQLRGAIDTLSFYRNNLGSIDNYLGKFQDTAGYQNSPCYSSTGCTPAQWTAMRNSEVLGSQSQKKATDALFRGLDQQQSAMQSDARQLGLLQSAAQGSAGQLEAIGYANQLASHQANQLLQIRGLMIAQQNVIATRSQALADREAKEAAAAVQLRTGTFRASPSVSY